MLTITHPVTQDNLTRNTMAVPQDVQDALAQVQADADDVTVKTTTKTQTASALNTAQTADVNAGHDLTASKAKQASDLQSLLALLQTTYGS